MDKKKKDLEEEFDTIEEFEDLEEEILEDEEVFEDLEEEIVEDEVEDEVVEDEVVEDKKPTKKEKKAKKEKKGKKEKKPLTKGKKAGIAIGSIFGVAAIVLVFLFVIMPIIMPANNGEDVVVDLIMAKGGYQKYVDASKLELRSDATFYKIYSVEEMLSETSLSMENPADQKQIASNIFNLAVTNYSNLKATSWYCYTVSSVYGLDAKALGVLSLDRFEVVVKAAYYISAVQTDCAANLENPDAPVDKQRIRDNEFSSTISGVPTLDLDGVPKSITDTIKSSFGFNIQNCLYEGTYAYRRGKNGGKYTNGTNYTVWYGDDSDLGYKYPMGAWHTQFPTKLKNKLQGDGARGVGHFSMADYNPATDNTSQKLDYIETPADEIRRVGSYKPWDPLNTYYNYAYEQSCYGNREEYFTGNFGAGWAPYDFSIDNLSDETKVTYDPETHVYTIEMVVKEEKANDACRFAKGSLTKDTKDYIKMQNVKYSLTKNTIEIFDNGLIKSWDREESIDSTEKAELIVLSGECKKGGGTTNKTKSSFSYEMQDCDPLAQAALYWPELGDKSIVGDRAFDLKGYTTFDEYNPTRPKKK